MQDCMVTSVVPQELVLFSPTHEPFIVSVSFKVFHKLPYVSLNSVFFSDVDLFIYHHQSSPQYLRSQFLPAGFVKVFCRT